MYLFERGKSGFLETARLACIVTALLLPWPVHAGPQSIYKDRSASTTIQKILVAARSWLNVPYRYGGTSRSGIDCSALVQNAFASIGVRIPRTAVSQYESSRKLDQQALRPGDLVFFRIRRNRPVSHVGIYLGNNRMLHASQAAKKVRVADFSKPYWKKRFVSGGRVLAQSLARITQKHDR